LLTLCRSGCRTIRQVTRNVKRWYDAEMALQCAAAGMMEAKKGLKAYRQLPRLRQALAEHAKTSTITVKAQGSVTSFTQQRLFPTGHVCPRVGEDEVISLSCRLP
jgi:hypothetical protein